MIVDTMPKLLTEAARRWPDHDALVFPDHRHRFESLLAAARLRAMSLIGLGIEPGDHVGILMPNCPEYIELLFGITMAGAVAVPVNARYKAAELGYVVANANLAAVVTNDLISEFANFNELLVEGLPGLDGIDDPTAVELESAPDLRFVAMLGETQASHLAGQAAFESAANGVDAAVLDTIEVDPGSPAIMMYTSGTTADPKGCPLDHGPLVRNGVAMSEQRYFLTAADRFWAPLPMFHMASVLPLIACCSSGAALLSMLRVEAGPSLAMMSRERVTVAFPAFPTVMNDLINHPDFETTDLSSIRRLNNVAPPDLLLKFQQALPQAIQTGAYGLTEACGVIAYNHPDEDLETRLTTCGQPFEGIEVKIVDPETLDELPAGSRGEIWIRGYAVFRGYYRAPEKNAEAFHDGWFRTGDLCSLTEDGRIAFHGRIKDMLKVGGENVAAIEIESLLARHPAVKLAQVIGVPDARLAEVAAAYIELNDDAAASEADLIDFCRGKIASFKVPRHVRFVDEWPMSSTKVQKHKLREAFDNENAR